MGDTVRFPIHVRRRTITSTAIFPRVSADTFAVIGVLAAVSWSSTAAGAQHVPPAVPVSVTNPVTLNPATPNPVTIGNPTDIAKAAGIQHPYSTEVQCQATNQTVCVATFTAPSDQRLVLEYVGAHCGIAASAQLASAAVTATNAGTSTSNFIGIHSVVAGAINSQTVTRLMRIYVDAGTTVTVSFSLNSSTSANCAGGIQGQAINVP